MKLSKLFHTLYATVMALPVLIIPIFALNILHKETEPISIEVQEKVSVDFNQMVNDNFNNYNDNGLTIENVNQYQVVINGTSTQQIGSGSVGVNFTNSYFRFKRDRRKYLIRFNQLPSGFYLGVSGYAITNQTSFIFQQSEGTDWLGYIRFQCNQNVTFNQFTCNLNIYDLTKMYGEGNEPTINEFEIQYPNYTDYTESQKMLVNKPSPTTYNDTDIGSQFVYALYKPVHDYFNFGEFFGLGGMYDWFQLNIFNGTAPLSFFIVFNVMIYWLFISLFWLLFDILIYVPMVIHKWLDKAEM